MANRSKEAAAKRKQHPLKKYQTVDNLILAVICAAFVVWSTVYPKLMLLVYSTEFWANTDHFIKVLVNLVAFHERPLMRNLVFNSIRTLSDEANCYYVFGDRDDQGRMIRLVLVWVFTWYLQKHVGRQFFLDRPLLYSIINIFYVVGFGVQFLADISRVEQHHDSNFWMTLLHAAASMNYFLIGDLLEDLVYRDLGSLGGIWHNWGFYGAPICITLETLVLEHFHERGAFKDPVNSVYHSVMTQGKTPLNWPEIRVDNIHNDHLCIQVFASNLTFGCFIFYGMANWRRQFDRSKKRAMKLLQKTQDSKKDQ